LRGWALPGSRQTAPSDWCKRYGHFTAVRSIGAELNMLAMRSDEQLWFSTDGRKFAAYDAGPETRSAAGETGGVSTRVLAHETAYDVRERGGHGG
jgi:hypothetical protein